MRFLRKVLSAAAVLSLLTVVLGQSATATAEAPPDACPSAPSPQHPSNPAFYDYVHTYRSCLSTEVNWDRTFPDVSMTAVDGSVPISVTTSTALAGAIASVKVNGKEYIASGGHGSALQYAFHAWTAGGASTECYNPTQAGTRLDDADVAAPYHGPSTSALYQMRRTGATIETASRPAMFIERSDAKEGWGNCRATDYQPDRAPFTFGLSPYWLTTTIRMAPDHGLDGLDNVIKLSAKLDSEDDLYAGFDAVMVAYLQRDFVDTYLYNRATRGLDPFSGDLASNEPPVRCTADGLHCMGLYRPAGGYYYTMTRPPGEYNGYSGEQTIQVTTETANVGAGGQTSLNYLAYLAVGSKNDVTSALAELGRQDGR
jgi:hypothetical protein